MSDDDVKDLARKFATSCPTRCRRCTRATASDDDTENIGDIAPGETGFELQEAMAEISESVWCAGWLNDLGFILWAHINRDDRPNVNLARTSDDEYHRASFVRLTTAAATDGGWCYWPVGSDGVRYVSMEKWLPTYEGWVSVRVGDLLSARRVHERRIAETIQQWGPAVRELAKGPGDE